VALRQSINGCVNALVHAGYTRSHIGAAMAGIGLSIHYVNGGDFEKIVAACRLAIEQDQSTRQ
jgi:hypothetical protein